MKTKLITTLAITALITTVFSCKSETKNQTEANAAEEVTKGSTTATAYKLDGASSIIEWVGKKPTGQHSGNIKVTNGLIQVQDKKIQSGSFIIDMMSINVTDLEGDEKISLERHLKGEGEGKEDHFFNVAKFPNAKFEITGITENDGKTSIDGNLTIKGITKNISFPANTSLEGNVLTLNTEKFTINRTDWGVNYASKSIIADIGDKFINDDIELKISVKANKE